MQYELPPHPEHTMQWSPREQRVIVNHVNQAIEPLQKRIADLEAQTAQLTASLETASSAVIVLKQQQREGWAQIASGQQPLSDAQINSACLSRDHSFGLMDANKRALMIFSAREWERAFAKEKP
jgi:hypothetical protein